MDSSLALKWLDGAFFSGSCSTSEPVCTEEFVLVGERGMSDREILRPAPPLRRGLLRRILGGRCHVKIELHLLLLVCLSSAGAGVAGVKQHLVLAIGGVWRPERGIVKNSKLPPYILHVNFHLLHGAVEDTFSLFHRKGDFFRHEVAIIDGDPGSRRAKERD